MQHLLAINKVPSVHLVDRQPSVVLALKFRPNLHQSLTRFKTELIELFNRSKPQRKEILLLFYYSVLFTNGFVILFMLCLCYVFCYVSLRKQPTFRNVTTGFPAK